MSKPYEFHRIARVDGLVAIPKKIRDEMGLEVGDPVKIVVQKIISPIR